MAEKREHEREVMMKAVEENNNFSKMAEEKLQMKMDQIKENREAYLAAIMERLQEKVNNNTTWATYRKDSYKGNKLFSMCVKVWSDLPLGEACRGGAEEQGTPGRADSMSPAVTPGWTWDSVSISTSRPPFIDAPEQASHAGPLGAEDNTVPLSPPTQPHSSSISIINYQWMQSWMTLISEIE